MGCYGAMSNGSWAHTCPHDTGIWSQDIVLTCCWGVMGGGRVVTKIVGQE